MHASIYHYPTRLKKGDLIGVVAPAGPVNSEALQRGVTRLESEGFRVMVGESVLGGLGYFSGKDEARLADLNRCLRNPEVRAIIAARGGYGCTRILDGVDYQALARDPKILVGFSDLTALLQACTVKTGVITYHGPMVQSNFGGVFDEPSFAVFRSSLMEPPGSTRLGFSDWSPAPVILKSGKAEGRLWGGCLSLLGTLQGTIYASSLEKSLFFWEDVREEPYRLDRMLQHLVMAAKAGSCSAVLVGRLAKCEPEKPEQSFTIVEVLAHHFPQVPVVMNLPFGHFVPTITLPIGGQARLDTAEGVLVY